MRHVFKAVQFRRAQIYPIVVNELFEQEKLAIQAQEQADKELAIQVQEKVDKKIKTENQVTTPPIRSTRANDNANKVTWSDLQKKDHGRSDNNDTNRSAKRRLSMDQNKEVIHIDSDDSDSSDPDYETPPKKRRKTNNPILDPQSYKRFKLFTGEFTTMNDIWVRQGKKSSNYGVQYNALAQKGKAYTDEYWKKYKSTPALEYMNFKQKTSTFGEVWQDLYSHRRMDAALKIVVLEELATNFKFEMNLKSLTSNEIERIRGTTSTGEPRHLLTLGGYKSAT